MAIADPPATLGPRSCHLLLTLLAGALLPMAAGAQSPGATLMLRVLAHESGKPVGGAQVSFPGLNIGGLSDADGRVRITGIPEGTHPLEVRHLGFRTDRLRIAFARDAVVEGEIELILEAIALDSVRVTVVGQLPALRRNGFYGRMQMGVGSFMTREQIRARGALTVSEALRGVEGTRVRPTRGATGHHILQSRFGSECHVLIWIDGVPSSAADLEGMGTERIAGIEVYHGSALPTQFNQIGARGYSPCGAAVIWTDFPAPVAERPNG
jgi:hypothetical protein